MEQSKVRKAVAQLGIGKWQSGNSHFLCTIEMWQCTLNSNNDDSQYSREEVRPAKILLSIKETSDSQRLHHDKVSVSKASARKLGHR